MKSKLYKLCAADREAAKAKLRLMTSDRLLATLEDTLQYDVMDKDNVEWGGMNELTLYRAIVAELRQRLL